MAKESKFQHDLIQDLRVIFVGCVILKNDPNYLQGFPDLLILFEDRWAALEVKDEEDADRQPNQEYYVDKTRKMSYGSFIYPENRERVLNELQTALRSGRRTRFPRS